ncbi:MAG: phenylacetate--CoA ligase family protein [Betaproteobacteria bacterium]|nr:phenylacetate--CoA ligase family protein [Betaproteobacteria bacterium]
MTGPLRQSVPWYGRSLDFEALWKEYPPPPDYFDHAYRMSRDALREVQEKRFLRQMERAWQIPFYRIHWSAAGMEPGDVRRLDDLKRIPPYTVYDIRRSIERDPPWGDFVGLDMENDQPLPLIVQTSGGTTSLPRPMLYAPQDREVMNISMGRRLYMQGVRPFDAIQIALSLGLSNGGIAAREGAWKYSGAIPVMTGSGANTPTRRQLEILKAWRVNFLMGFPSYLRHMALVCRDEMGIDPRSMGLKGLLVHLGVDSREVLEDLWGAPAFDCYGVHECGVLAADCEQKSGMHIFEDAFVIEIVDPETGKEMAEGERGTMFLTSFYRHLAPVIRYNVNDVSAFANGECACGGTQRRLERIYGRTDHMVKLRGVNVFPEAIGEIVARNPRCNGEFVCIVETSGANQQDELTVMVEMAHAQGDVELIAAELGRSLKEGIGLRAAVKVVRQADLDELTGLNRTSKIQRLIDRREPNQ